MGRHKETTTTKKGTTAEEQSNEWEVFNCDHPQSSVYALLAFAMMCLHIVLLYRFFLWHCFQSSVTMYLVVKILDVFQGCGSKLVPLHGAQHCFN